MIDIIGWLGSIFFSICALPQAIKSYKEKSSKGISKSFMILWFLGEVLTLIYILLTTVQIPLIVNYVFNLICLSVVAYYIQWFKKGE